MTDGHEARNNDLRKRDPTDSLDHLVLDYVDRLNAGEKLKRRQIIEAHPDIASELVDRLETFVDLGMESDSDTPLGTLNDYTLRRRTPSAAWIRQWMRWGAVVSHRVSSDV